MASWYSNKSNKITNHKYAIYMLVKFTLFTREWKKFDDDMKTNNNDILHIKIKYYYLSYLLFSLILLLLNCRNVLYRDMKCGMICLSHGAQLLVLNRRKRSQTFHESSTISFNISYLIITKIFVHNFFPYLPWLYQEE